MDSEIADDAEARERTLDRMYRCVETLLAQIGRDHERCGKTICKRSRRCRGFACTPDIADGETEGAAVRYRAAEQTGR